MPRAKVFGVAMTIIALGAQASPTSLPSDGNESHARTDAHVRSERRDARRFNTWSGYSSLRFPEGVATGDFNADRAIDVAFARSDFFAQGMTAQLNLGDGTMGPPTSYPATDESSDFKTGDLDGIVVLKNTGGRVPGSIPR